jgi:hypothetical protein
MLDAEGAAMASTGRSGLDGEQRVDSAPVLRASS